MRTMASSHHARPGSRVTRLGCRLALCVAVLELAGCGVLPLAMRTRLPTHSAITDQRLLDDGYEDFAGVIHVHTNYSHDAHGTYEQVIRVANRQGLDFVITTEHNTLQALRDGWQGWHGAVLLLIGVEWSLSGGHYLALNITKEFDRHALTTQDAIDHINRQGGLGFIAHPYFKKRRWTDWSVTGFTGIEGYNTAHDTLDENRARLILWTLMASPESFYLSLLDRPYDPLRTWDTLIKRHGRVVGIGASDAHQIHVAGMTFAPYTIMFRLARTHVLVPDDRLTPEALYAALRQGHTYFSIELASLARGFVFAAEDGQRVHGIMGDTVALTPGLHLYASAPGIGEIALLRDGTFITRTTGAKLRVPVTEPGVYRVEVSQAGTPWIFSNPIYVQSGPVEPATATVPLP